MSHRAMPAQLDAPPAGTRILHVVPSGEGPVSELAAIAIAAQRRSRLAAGVAGEPRAAAAVIARSGVPAGELLRIEAPVGDQPAPGDPKSAFALHRAYPFTDIVHAHGLGAGVIAALGMTGLPRRLRPALVVTLGRDAADTVIDRSGQALIARHADAVLGSTSSIADAYDGRVPVSRRAPLLEPETGTLPPPEKDRAAVREELGLDEGAWLIVSPIALHDSTALTTLLDASRSFGAARAGRSAVLALTGEGGERGTIRREFLPRRDFSLRLPDTPEALNVLAAADVLVLGERNSRLSGDELLQLGKPVVGVGGGVLPVLLGESAPLIAPDDTEGLVAAVDHLLDDPVARAVQGQALKRRVLESSSEDVSAALLLDAYAAALKAHRERH